MFFKVLDEGKLMKEKLNRQKNLVSWYWWWCVCGGVYPLPGE